MKLSRRTLIVVITLMVISLGGLIGLQVYMLQLALEQKEQSFRRNVFAALKTVSQRLENSETFTVALGKTGDPPGTWQFNVSGSAESESDSIRLEGLFVEAEKMVRDAGADCPLSVQDGVLRYEIASPQHVMIKVYDQTEGTDHIVVDTFKAAGKYEVDMGGLPPSGSRIMYVFRSDSSSALFQMQNGSELLPIGPELRRTRKEDYVKRVVSNLVVAELKPIEDRITAAALDTLIQSALAESGINLDFEYAVFAGLNDSLRVPAIVQARDQLQKTEFRTRLFPNDMLSARSELAVFFPEHSVYLWKQMSALVLTNLLFITVIVAVFVYTVRVMLVQKQFSLRIVDFINNMTHEFKTPISTVALACEAIMRPEVINQPERIGKYGRMILDENQRMRNQVEKILQMAVIEEGDYELKLSQVDLHQIIRKAIEGISLQIENRHGRLTQKLEATEAIVDGDSLHLTNIINNLLDNANKYSPDAPEINVTTTNEPGEMVVTISDKGLGIAEADQKAVFDKYYRVHSGNLHNVKGFGLGLSYVRMMVEAHHGKIRLQSKPGEGTMIELRFPISRGPE
jgi:two-component system phosphate regulon sensor histidine kinase PhoR